MGNDQSIRLDSAHRQTLCNLIAEYSDELIRFACCFTHDFSAAEDVAEDAFAELVFRKKHFPCKQAFKAYLYKTARSKCIDRLRENKRNVALDGTAAIKSEDGEEDFFKAAQKKELYDCIASLPTQYGEALCLCYIDGFSVDELCAILKCNKKRVYNLLSRAKAALKPLLIERGIFYENL
ncbi:MAG: RNA polymerase sigma factor [Candidatus Coproplasma sp.]